MMGALLLASALLPAAPGEPNRLSRELDPYLRQHARDAIDWFPWGADALEAARSRRLPLLLSVGRAGCHACATLDRTLLGDPELAAVVQRRFVPVKVDRDEHPELEEVLGFGPGLAGASEPLLVVLSADGTPGAPYAGATGSRGDLAPWLSADGPPASPAAPSPGAPGVGSLARLTSLLQRTEAGDAPARQELAQLLEAIARGGVRDQLAGGFHHGPRDGSWQVPWFEKLLRDNAVLIRAYARAFASTRDLLQRDVVRETVAWTLRDLRDPSGAFLASMDATSEGQEGRYYLWTKEELLATLGAERGQEFFASYRLEPPGVLQLTGSPFAGLGASREVLQTRRGRRVRPSVDDKVLAADNGLMISALATSGSNLRRGPDLEAARRAAGSVLERLGPAAKLRHYAVGGQAAGSALLADYAFLGEGLLDLYEATRETRWRDEAAALADAAVARLWDVAGGGFFGAESQPGLRNRPKPAQDRALPSPNGTMAALLLRLGRATGQQRYTALGLSTLQAFQAEVARDPEACATLKAAERWRPSPPPSR
jgi:uncharacterized protein YyaL (SSP411 family)